MNLDWAAAEAYLLGANLVAHSILIAGVAWCVAFPARRIYPWKTKTPGYYAMWFLFIFVFFTNPVFIFLDWNTGIWSSALRFWVGVPVLALGFSFLLWGITTLGLQNTSGLRAGFVAAGPYLFSRNPQYVGDFFIFAGIIILANSGIVLVTHLLTALVFVLAPLAEEPWLESEYGEAYVKYRGAIPRFL